MDERRTINKVERDGETGTRKRKSQLAHGTNNSNDARLFPFHKLPILMYRPVLHSDSMCLVSRPPPFLSFSFRFSINGISMLHMTHASSSFVCTLLLLCGTYTALHIYLTATTCIYRINMYVWWSVLSYIRRVLNRLCMCVWVRYRMRMCIFSFIRSIEFMYEVSIHTQI